MEVVHRVGIHVDDTVRRELKALGMDVAAGLAAFDVAESDPDWPEWSAWIRRRRPSDVVWTTFDEAEVAAAAWSTPSPDLHQGFPQPRDDEFGYLTATYDTSGLCEACGIGLRQRAPFQLKGDPNWGRRGILQLHWVYDEYFVKPSIWDSVLRPFGIEVRAVTRPSGIVLEQIVQVVNEEVVPTDVRGLAPVVCPQCSRPKYRPVVRGPLPAPRVEPRGHIARSVEWFGSGGSAFNEVLVSRALVAALRSAGVRGVSFLPATRVG